MPPVWLFPLRKNLTSSGIPVCLNPDNTYQPMVLVKAKTNLLLAKLSDINLQLMIYICFHWGTKGADSKLQWETIGLNITAFDCASQLAAALSSGISENVDR